MRWKELGVLFLLSTTCGLFIAVVPLPGLPLLAKLAAQGVLFMASFAFMLWWTRILNPDERRLMLLPLGLVSRLFSPLSNGGGVMLAMAGYLTWMI